MKPIRGNIIAGDEYFNTIKIETRDRLNLKEIRLRQRVVIISEDTYLETLNLLKEIQKLKMPKA